MSRPELGRDESYNRIRVPSDLKSQICSQIADSSESLPLVSESEESLPAETLTSQPISRQEPPRAVPTSKLAESTLSSEIPTPTPERPNPLEHLEQVVTAQKDGQATPSDITPSQTTSTKDGDATGDRPKMKGRPSTMHRIGSAIKRTVSSKHD